MQVSNGLLAFSTRRLKAILASSGSRHIWDVFGIPDHAMGRWTAERPIVVSLDLGMRNMGMSVLSWPQRDMGTADNSCEIFGPLGGEWPFVQTLLIDLFPPETEPEPSGRGRGRATASTTAGSSVTMRMLLSYYRQVLDNLVTPYSQLLREAKYVLVEKPYMRGGRYGNPGVPLFILANVLGALFRDKLVFVDPAEVKRWLGWTQKKHPAAGYLPLGGHGLGAAMTKAGPQGYVARKADALRVAREAALLLESMGMADKMTLSARMAGAHKADDMADSLLNLLVWMCAAFHKIPCYVYDPDLNGCSLAGMCVAMQALFGPMDGMQLSVHTAVQSVLARLPPTGGGRAQQQQ